MTMKHHHWSRKAHITLLTNFKLILLIHMTFFKLLFLDVLGGHFCNHFPIVRSCIKIKHVIEVYGEKT